MASGLVSSRFKFQFAQRRGIEGICGEPLDVRNRPDLFEAPIGTFVLSEMEISRLHFYDKPTTRPNEGTAMVRTLNTADSLRK